MRTSSSPARTRRVSARVSRRPARAIAASSSRRTCVDCIPSTKSSPSASHRPASTRSPSTTSGAPRAPSRRGDDFEFREHVAKTKTTTIQADIASATGHISRRDGRPPHLRPRVLHGWSPGVLRIGRARRARRRDRFLRAALARARARRARRQRTARPDARAGPRVSSAAPTRASRASEIAEFDAALKEAACSTTSRLIPERRTLSSTAHSPSTSTRATMRGGARSPSSRQAIRRRERDARYGTDRLGRARVGTCALSGT